MKSRREDRLFSLIRVLFNITNLAVSNLNNLTGLLKGVKLFFLGGGQLPTKTPLHVPECYVHLEHDLVRAPLPPLLPLPLLERGRRDLYAYLRALVVPPRHLQFLVNDLANIPPKIPLARVQVLHESLETPPIHLLRALQHLSVQQQHVLHFVPVVPVLVYHVLQRGLVVNDLSRHVAYAIRQRAGGGRGFVLAAVLGPHRPQRFESFERFEQMFAETFLALPRLRPLLPFLARLIAYRFFAAPQFEAAHYARYNLPVRVLVLR